MSTIKVSTQAELDKALADTNNGHDGEIHIVGGKDLVLPADARIEVVRDAHVRSVYGSGQVGSVSDFGQVGSVSDFGQVGSVSDFGQVGSVSGSGQVGYVYGSGQVGYVSGSGQVGSVSDFGQVGSVSGSGQVGSVSGSGQVGSVSDFGQVGSVSGSGQVGSVSDSATVHVRGKNATVKASDTPVIWLHVDDTPNVKGGRQLRAPEPEPMSVERALRLWNLSGKKVTLYKGVCADLKSGEGFHYPIGETVEADDWHDRPECGGGLHLCPDPSMTLRYFSTAERWLECEVAVEDLAVCSAYEGFPDKVKARRVRVVREVNLRGEPVG